MSAPSPAAQPAPMHGMRYADISTSPRRNARFLTPSQQAALLASPSESAMAALTRRMGARRPRAAS